MKDMKKRISFLLLISYLTLSLISCGRSIEKADAVAEDQNVTAAEDASAQTDDTGTVDADETIEADADGMTVVATARSIASLWLLAGGELAGATEDSMDLSGLNEGCVSIGTPGSPNIEAIIGLNPDLVLLSADIPTQKKAKAALEEAGVNCRDIDINSFEDYDDAMKEFTRTTGRADLYEADVTKVKTAIDEVISEVPEEIKGKNFLLIKASGEKTKALKNDNFVSAMLTDLGMENVVGDDSKLDSLSIEWITEADPDYIFVIPMGDNDEAKAAFESAFTTQPAWSALSAVESGRCFFLDKELFEYKPNNHWAEAYDQLLGMAIGD